MSTDDLEDRVHELETRVRDLEKSQLHQEAIPWWEQISGAFKNDPDYAEAMKLARRKRAAQKTP